MKTKVILIMLVAALISCTEKLDIKPSDTVDSGTAASSSKDIEALLVGAYTLLGNGDVLGGNMQRDSELIGDDGEIFWDGTFVDPGQIYIKQMLITNGQAEETWLESYEAINTANAVLANIDIITDDKRDRVEGEAKFLRGLLYFELVRVYAKTYIDGTPSSNPGLPLVLTPN
ncbi:MAG: RagB/SusD family nutrient uptake outer membrane protein, partial [Cyclobacteriaceae bacterium]